MEGSNVGGDESGGTSPSRQGADTGILSPRKLMAMAAEIGIAFGEKGSRIRVSSVGVKIGAKGGTGGTHQSARRAGGVGLGGARHPPGCLVVALLPCLGYSGSFRSADFLYNFSGIYWAL